MIPETASPIASFPETPAVPASSQGAAATGRNAVCTSARGRRRCWDTGMSRSHCAAACCRPRVLSNVLFYERINI